MGEARNPGSNGVRICDLTNAHGEEIEELFAIGFASLEGVDEARRTSLNREGDLIDLGLDHVVGRAALQLQIEISTRGRKQLAVPRSPVRRAGTGFTKAELEEIGQRFTRTWEFKALGEDHDSSQFDY